VPEGAPIVKEPRAVRIALAAIAACTSAVAFYAVIRVAQALLFSEPDPALVIWSPHAGFFWRAWTAAYGGGMVGFVAYVAAGRDARGTARVLSITVLGVSGVIAAQGILVP
jgi:hypothetical protein